MKILHVTKKYPPALGGDAIVVKSLQREQEAAGHRVVIVTSNCREIKAASRVYKVGLPDTPAQLDAITPRRLVSLVILAFKMFFIIRRERPEIIHTHSIDMAFFTSFAARFFKVPLVHTFHIVTFYDPTHSALRRKTELWLAKKAGLSAATAPNHFDVNKLRYGGLPQATLLPNGVDVTFWSAHKSGTSKNNVFTFVAVGRLETQKDFSVLVKAAAELSHLTAQPFKVVIIGDGSLKPQLEQLITTEGLNDIVKLVGSKSPAQVRAYFALADAAVCTSMYETTPLTLLEAWAAGLPVITTPVGIVRDTPPTFRSAFIVPPQNASALAAMMRHCIVNDGLRATTAQSGYDEVKKYTWPTIAQTAENVYRSAL